MEQIYRKALADGVRLTCVNTPKFKSAAMSVSLILPLGGGDTAALAALPHVLRRGTARYPDLNALGGALDGLYGMRVEAAVRKRGEALVIGLVADVIDETYGGEGLTGQAASLLLSFFGAPLLANGTLSPNYVQSEAANLADRIAARKNDLRSWVVRRLWELMCASEPYGQSELGDIASAQALTPARLTAAYTEALEKSCIELFYCGAQPCETVEAAFRAALPARAAGARTMPSTVIYARPPRGDVKRFPAEEMPVTQGKLSLGFRTGITSADPLYPALLLANTIYGGSTSSRLFLNVREKRSLCYYASSQIHKLKGVMAVTSGIDNEKEAVALEEILRQLTDLQENGAALDEIETARRILLGQLRAMSDSPMSLEGFWLDQAISGLEQPVEALLSRIAAVTPDEVTEAARHIVLDSVYFLKGAART